MCAFGGGDGLPHIPIVCLHVAAAVILLRGNIEHVLAFLLQIMDTFGHFIYNLYIILSQLRT